ncbi:MAG: hypothetical protein HY080_08380 [Gammaproteobacteria bacterium]|nr:hypothetical protein [Gammaproteobacteria bacterium]
MQIENSVEVTLDTTLEVVQPAVDFITDLMSRLAAAFFCLNSAYQPQTKRIAVSHIGSERRCVVSSRSGERVCLARRHFKQFVPDAQGVLIAAVEAVGGQCVSSADLLNLDLPAGYYLTLALQNDKIQDIQVMREAVMPLPW